VCVMNQLKIMLGSSVRRLFGPGGTWTSSPKLVPTPLIFLDRAHPAETQRLRKKPHFRPQRSNRLNNRV
jgi:hypothetical protein